jgi:hypothetical protein
VEEEQVDPQTEDDPVDPHFPSNEAAVSDSGLYDTSADLDDMVLLDEIIEAVQSHHSEPFLNTPEPASAVAITSSNVVDLLVDAVEKREVVETQVGLDWLRRLGESHRIDEPRSFPVFLSFS